MIKIKVAKGVPYIWDPQDWYKLRTEHRIVGVLDGALGTGLKGRTRWNLPMRLSDVEVQYLVWQKIACTIHAPSLYDDSLIITNEDLEKANEQRKQKQLDSYRNLRKLELEQYYNRILEGKQRKGKVVDLDKDTFIQKELNKIEKSPHDMYQLELGDPWLKEDDYLPYIFPLPQTYVERLRFKVFEDFHLIKKYWVTPGIKFGGDFLAYPGDPRQFHAEFIIICPEKDYKFDECIASQCRLSLTVKKTFLIAFLDEESDKLKYYILKSKLL